MKASLQVRLSQHLALTPQLQQSIRLLQLSTLELQQEVGQLLDENPFLELEDDGLPTPFDTPPERLSADRAASGESGSEGAEGVESAEASDSARELSADEFGTPARDDWENGTERDDFDGVRELPSKSPGASDAEDDGSDLHDRRAPTPSLQEHLRSQLVGRRLAPEEHAAVEVLIESLDGDGHLADPLDELAERLADNLGIAEAEDRERLAELLQLALCLLQSLDPPGVGARSLSECVVLQLKGLPPSPARALALRVAESHLDLLARRDTKRLAAATGADEAQLRQAHELIRRCEPKPGRPFGNSQADTLVPDVIVRRAARGFVVALNPDVMPRLRINDLYAQAAKGLRGAQANAGLSARLQEARWFVKNIQQRFDTILRVSRAIVERQKGFIQHGPLAMKPLVLREIADELGLHESTISRVTTAKYMATPQGTFELKHFFGSSLHTEAGGNASSTAVRALIQQFVAAEDPSRPLSDNQIAAMLEEQGIQVARRTVAKYRDALKIAPAGLRKPA